MDTRERSLEHMQDGRSVSPDLLPAAYSNAPQEDWSKHCEVFLDQYVSIIRQMDRRIKSLEDVRNGRGIAPDSSRPTHTDSAALHSSINTRLVALESLQLEHRTAELEKRLAEISSLGADMAVGPESNFNRSALQSSGSSSSPSSANVIEQCAVHAGKEANVLQETQTPDTNVKVDKEYDNRQTLPGELEHTYELASSIWDAFLFVGLPIADAGTTLLLSLLMVVNVLVQLMFCIICWAAFIQPEIDDGAIFGMRIWRWNSAHDVNNVNVLWPFSLASRVCEYDGSLPLAGRQVAQLESIGKYQPEYHGFVGELMCVVCLLCFWTSLWEDAVETFQLALAVLRLRGAFTRLLLTKDGLQFESIGHLRIAMVAVVVCLKVVVFVNIGVVGTIWLANMISVGDLLLNVLALQLVLTVDNLLFTGLAPLKARAFVESCAPLPCRLMPWSTIGTISICIGLPLIYVFLVRDTVDFVSKAAEALCGGMTNYVYSVDAFGIVYIHDNMASPNDPAFTEQGYNVMDARILALNEARAGIPHEDWQYAFYEPDLVELRRKASEVPFILAEKLNPNCEDLLTATTPRSTLLPLQAALRTAGADMSLDLCPSVEPYCYYQNGSGKFISMLARVMCPITCGCDALTTGTFLSEHLPEQLACPHMCMELKMERLAAMDTCQEAEVTGTSAWQTWMQEASYLLSDGAVQGLSQSAVQALKQNGCHALQDHLLASELCPAEGLIVKPLAPVCPESCECMMKKYSGGGGCPLVCFQANPGAPACRESICWSRGPGNHNEEDGSACICYLTCPEFLCSPTGPLLHTLENGMTCTCDGANSNSASNSNSADIACPETYCARVGLGSHFFEGSTCVCDSANPNPTATACPQDVCFEAGPGSHTVDGSMCICDGANLNPACSEVMCSQEGPGTYVAEDGSLCICEGAEPNSTATACPQDVCLQAGPGSHAVDGSMCICVLPDLCPESTCSQAGPGEHIVDGSPCICVTDCLPDVCSQAGVGAHAVDGSICLCAPTVCPESTCSQAGPGEHIVDGSPCMC